MLSQTKDGVWYRSLGLKTHQFLYCTHKQTERGIGQLAPHKVHRGDTLLFTAHLNDSDTHHSEVIIITGCLRDDLRNDL